MLVSIVHNNLTLHMKGRCNIKRKSKKKRRTHQNKANAEIRNVHALLMHPSLSSGLVLSDKLLYMLCSLIPLNCIIGQCKVRMTSPLRRESWVSIRIKIEINEACNHCSYKVSRTKPILSQKANRRISVSHGSS